MQTSLWSQIKILLHNCPCLIHKLWEGEHRLSIIVTARLIMFICNQFLAHLIFNENLFLVLIYEGLPPEVLWVLHRVVELDSFSARRDHSEELKDLSLGLFHLILALKNRSQARLG